MNTGNISQIIGVVVDVHFPDDLPALFNALEVKVAGKEPLILEVEQHIGSSAVRALAMGPTDGLERGMGVRDSGRPIFFPL